MSDERLARLAAARSEPAFAAIFERHHQALYRYCRSIVGNGHDAADALQNTMVRVLRSLPGETREIALRPWLYRIAHNESISLLRVRRPESDLEAAVGVSDERARAAVESRERLRSLTHDLAELTVQQRGALVMRELGGLDFAEIGGALGISAAAVKQSIYEARCALHALQEGRAMECETVRRTLSDGDRRMLRGKRMRGHLRACAGCRDFELALRARPAQLAALIPPLPLAAGAAMLHGLLGGAGGTGTGGGLAAGLAGSVKSAGALSVGAKVAAVAVTTGALAGGAAYVAPGLLPSGPPDSTVRTERSAAQRSSVPDPRARVNRPRSERSKPGSDPRRPNASPPRSSAGDPAGRRAVREPGQQSARPHGAGAPGRRDTATNRRPGRRETASRRPDSAGRDGGARRAPDRLDAPTDRRTGVAPQAPAAEIPTSRPTAATPTESPVPSAPQVPTGAPPPAEPVASGPAAGTGASAPISPR